MNETTFFRRTLSHQALSTIVFSFLSLAGCTSTPTETETDAPDGLVDFEVIFNGSGRGFLDPEYGAVYDERQFSSLWTRLHEGYNEVPSAPYIDFSNRMLVYAAMGQRPTGCYFNEILYVSGDGKVLSVTVFEHDPGYCACPPAVVEPVEVVAIPLFETRPVFDIHRNAVTCF